MSKLYGLGPVARSASGGLFDFKLRGDGAWTDTRLTNAVPGLGAGDGPRKSVNLGADVDLARLRLAVGGNLSRTSALDARITRSVAVYGGIPSKASGRP